MAVAFCYGFWCVKMTFRKRFLRFLYGFMGIVCIFLVVVYSIISGHNRTADTYNLLRQNAMVVSNSFDALIETSNSAINLIISEPSVLSSIRSISTGKMEDLTDTEKYYSEEYTLIRERINLYFIYKYCYRLIFFNETGDVIASNYSSGNRPLEKVEITEILGVDSLDEGALVVRPSHEDKWNSKNAKQVISVFKHLAGNNMGYFEIQWLKKDVEKMLAPSESDYEVAIYDSSGKVVYSNSSNQENYYQQIKSQGRHTGNLRIGNTLMSYTNKNGYCTVLSTQIHFWYDIVQPIMPALVALLILFWIVSIVFANIGANIISNPINTLQTVITKTDYDNLTKPNLSLIEQQKLRQVIEIDNTYKIYEQMLERLAESKKKAEKMSFLQMKAQLDLMQAQVNPHFIYNVLNIISAKGLMADDESICDMCDNLSKILRYSTNVKTKEATLREEIEYLTDYLMLLKCRYEKRLEYSIFIERELWDEIIPKLALQQLVENAVKHGFTDSVDRLEIEIEGKEFVEGWKISIKDNGGGISEDKLLEIRARITQLRHQLDEGQENIEFEIGGMGIFNTYARLYILYKQQLRFDINSGEAGTVVNIEVEKGRV